MHAYASQYYDPVKAHEYYERTKKLKGRSTSGMSEEQRKTWGFVKGNILSEKKQKREDLNEASRSETEELRNEAAAVRERIAEKLKKWISEITGEASYEKQTLSKAAKLQKEEIQAEKQRKLEAIPEIPKTASPEQKERMRLSNAQERADINNETKEKLSAIMETTSEKRIDVSQKATSEKSEARESSTQERKVVSEKLKASIFSVREKVKEIKETLNATTEETLDREYANIMKNIAGKSTKAKKSKTSSTTGSYVETNKEFIKNNLAKLKSKS